MDERLASINSEIDKETQSIANNQAKLGQLNQEFPP
jgi:hypothetical protein